ncbi:MAG: TetR/AcrR family transcriptional regulator [Acetobacteraceae bacterium]
MRTIVEAAARILEQHGLSGFTTNAVAERAGVSIGSLYQYFPNKEALTGALIHREMSILLADVAEALCEASGQAALTRLITAAVQHQLRRPALARLLDFQESRLPLDQEIRRVSDDLRRALAQILARPDLPTQQDGDMAAADIFAIVKGMVDAAGERGECDSAALEKRVGRAVFGYLRSR